MEKYREFLSEKQAEEWGEKSFPNLVSKEFQKTKEFDVLYSYGGGLYLPINASLRGANVKYDGLELYINTLKHIVLNNFVPENIIVYRSIDIRCVQLICKQSILKEGLRFSDKAFLSTSLFKGSAVSFGKEQRYDCILKLFLPKGTRGAYISYKGQISVLHEQELLLAPETNFEILKIHHLIKPKLIECKAIEK